MRHVGGKRPLVVPGPEVRQAGLIRALESERSPDDFQMGQQGAGKKMPGTTGASCIAEGFSLNGGFVAGLFARLRSEGSRGDNAGFGARIFVS